jgi:Uma2 family endonuclease
MSIITTNAAGQTMVTLEPHETLAKDDGQLLIVQRPPRPNIDHLITEDDTPVDNFSSAVQQRLLVEPLYTTWQGGNPPQRFLADENVGLFESVHEKAIVPDVFLSLDVQRAEDWWAKENRSYLIWEMGKPPEIVIEIVSNRVGGVETQKSQRYGRMGIPYYIIFDPSEQLRRGVLRVYERRAGSYVETQKRWFAEVGLGLTLWQGAYEGKEGTWLRWCDERGNVILTGAERTERLATQLRALGVDPEA